MSKAAARTKRAEQLERMRAEEARRERNRRLLIAGSTVAIVVVIIAAFIVAKALTGSSGTSNTATTRTAASSVIRDVTSVPVATLDQVGAGPQTNNHPAPLSGAPPLTTNGQPEVLYVGAEYCPYCAATRWGLVVALSRFGTFSGLGQTESGSNDVFPNTPTLTFHGSSYTSKYLAFRAYETADRNGQTLDNLTGADKTAFTTYDAPPYVPPNAAQTIPFLDIGGKYLQSGSAFDPGLLQGKSHQQIAASLKNPKDPIAQAVNGEANSVTAAICAITHQQPSSVCSTSGVQAAAKNLTSSAQGAGSSGG